MVKTTTTISNLGMDQAMMKGTYIIYGDAHKFREMFEETLVIMMLPVVRANV